MIREGFKLSHEEAEKLTGQKLNKRIFDWAPQGARLMVVLDRVPEMAGLVALPESVIAASDSGTGWIVGCGPIAGLQEQMGGTVGPIQAKDPSDLLGLHVSFGFARGMVLRFSILDNEYKSKVLLLAPIDILCVDGHLDPLSVDDFELAYQLTKQAEKAEKEAAESMRVAREALFTEGMFGEDPEEAHGKANEIARDLIGTDEE